MLKKVVIVAAILFPVTAMAQTPDVDILQRVVAPLQTQRNQALDAAAVAEARVGSLTEQLTKVTARVKELEDKYEPKKADDKPPPDKE